MPLQTFRHYTICQDQQGATVEVWRSADEVACLAFDNKQQIFIELHVAIGPAERQRDAPAFQNLVQLAAPLRHRHLLGVFEGGEDEGANYYVSEYLDGERLDAWLARCHPLPPWLALHLIRQLVEGLAALASHPSLLAGVEVFHAGLSLAGPHSDDLNVKVCDLGLSGILPVSTEPQFVEARAIRDTGRLLLYMLTGSLTERAVTPESLAASHVAPELGFLLSTMFNATMPHHPRTLEQLRALTERCAQDLSPELTARPDLLPATYRPSLPLAPHMADPGATAERLSNDYTLDTRPADSADPYRHLATQRAIRRPVNVQILPPPNLLPSPQLLPLVEKAWTALDPGPGSPAPAHLLAPLAWDPEAPCPLLVEELPGKYSLETLRRLRQALEPAEVLLLLTQLHAAATEAEALSLTLHWKSPRLIPVQFTGPGGESALPPPSQLARTPLTEWPPFLLKVRTWPIALDFTQPDRFQLERLLPRDPALSGEALAARASAGGPPTARDLALLTTWLLGGTPLVKENLKSLLYSAISARGPALGSRAEFLERFRQRLSGPPTSPTPAAVASTPAPPAAVAKTATPATAPSAAPTTLTLGKSKSKSKSRARLKSAPVPAPAPPRQPGPETASPPQSPLPEDDHEAEEPPAMGFAEALFGTPADSFPDSPPQNSGPLWPTFADPAEAFPSPDHDPYAESPPLGFMEAAGQTAPRQASGSAWMDEADESGSDPRSTSRWTLVLTVVLIAAALAALMAQLSGQAIWLK